MEKRTEHVSFCVTPEVADQIRAIASMRDVSPSELMATLAEAEIAREHARYVLLSRVFSAVPGIGDISGKGRS